MFLVILLFLVFLSLSLKEGLGPEESIGEIYENYNRIDKTIKDYKEKFNSLAN
jgi:hypothetical protein